MKKFIVCLLLAMLLIGCIAEDGVPSKRVRSPANNYRIVDIGGHTYYETFNATTPTFETLVEAAREAIRLEKEIEK